MKYAYPTSSTCSYTNIAPSKFFCPLTGEIMSDPVMTRFGDSFEQSALLVWLDHNNECPMTGFPLVLSDCAPNSVLQLEITVWIIEHDEEANAESETEDDDSYSICCTEYNPLGLQLRDFVDFGPHCKASARGNIKC